jgi:hypothetical protein
MSDEEPAIVKLVNAVLLSMIKKKARAMELRVDHGGAIVEFDRQLELRPPARIAGPMRRRLEVMASLPYRRKGEVATGTITLWIGDASVHHFGIEVDDAAVRVTRLDAPAVLN